MRVPNKDMLALVREYKGKTQTEVAAGAGVTQGYISKSENGQIVPPEDVLRRIAGALDWPVEFFYRTEQVYGFGSSCTYHRKQASASMGALHVAQATANILRLAIAPLFDEISVDHPNELPRLDIDENGGSPEQIARIVRSTWQLPLGPVANMVAVIEAAGGVIYRYSFGTRRLSAVSHWPPSSRPIFLVNSELPADRTRFSLAHELGHLVMHELPSVGEMEREADHFASEFLMPEREIVASLNGLTLERAAQLKAYWKVSIQALIVRARDLGAIPPSRSVRLFAELNRLGYRLSEPVDLPTEEPTLLRSVLDTHRREHDYTLDDLVSLSGMPMKDFVRFHPGDRPQLRVVS